MTDIGLPGLVEPLPTRTVRSGGCGDSATYVSVAAPFGSDEVADALRRVTAEPRITLAFRRAEDLRLAALRSIDPAKDARALEHAMRSGDDVTAIAALHALGAIDDPHADQVLFDVVNEGGEPFAGHAAWALEARKPRAETVLPLVRLVLDGGFQAMLAEHTLMEWSRVDDRLMIATDDEVGRGLGQLSRALSDARPGALPVGRTIEHNWAAPFTRHAEHHGLVVVQPYLHAHVDKAGSSLGAGEAGGIASLLRSLGTPLAQSEDIAEVITVTRRHGPEPGCEQLAPDHRVQRIEFGPTGTLPWRETWVYRTDIEREFAAIGRALAGRRVVWHLRMADVGTLAAAATARRLGHAMVFTAAPDPHIVIDAMQDSGRITRGRFAVEDAAHQFWFRARLVERLVAEADRLVLLPRPGIHDELVALVGVDPADLSTRASTIAEGVDVAEIAQARVRLHTEPVPPAATRVLASLPPERRDLPWVLTVGRLHPTKGSQRIVDAVTLPSNYGEPHLTALVNIIVVGGDINRPSPDEQSTLERIRRAADGSPTGLVSLAGHLPPAEVNDLMAFAAANGGVYVCASDKEEFGLSIVEALAAGLVVVAPARGGPRTYVTDGDNGVLVDTLNVDALRNAIIRARTLIDVEGRRERSIAMVRSELSVQGMAERLNALYRDIVPRAVPV